MRASGNRGFYHYESNENNEKPASEAIILTFPDEKRRGSRNLSHMLLFQKNTGDETPGDVYGRFFFKVGNGAEK